MKLDERESKSQEARERRDEVAAMERAIMAGVKKRNAMAGVLDSKLRIRTGKA